MTTKTTTSDQSMGSVAEEIAQSRDRDWFHEAGLSAARFLEANIKPVLGLFAIGLLGWSGWLGWDYVQTRQEKAALEAFFPIEKQISERREKIAKREALERQLKAEKDSKAKAKLQADLAAAATPTQDETLKLAEDAKAFSSQNSGRVAGVVSALESSKLFQEVGEYQKAVETLKASAQSTRSNTFWGGVTRVALAGQLVNFASSGVASACDEVTDWVSPITSDKSLGFLWSEAHLKVGICHLLNGRKDQAKAALLLSQKGAQEMDPKKPESPEEANALKGIEPGSSAETATSLLRALEAGLIPGSANAS